MLSIPTAKPCTCGKHVWNFRLGCWLLTSPDGSPKISSYRDHGTPPCAPDAKRSRTPNQHMRILRPPQRTRIA